MKQILLENITEECKYVRKQLEKLSKNLEDNKEFIWLDKFPIGTCGLVCNVLGGWLKNKMNVNCEYICGTKGDFSHAWLECEDVIIDITADQFDEISTPVIVMSKNKSTFHNSWKEESRHEVYLYELQEYPECYIYSCLEKDIKKT